MTKLTITAVMGFAGYRGPPGAAVEAMRAAIYAAQVVPDHVRLLFRQTGRNWCREAKFANHAAAARIA